MVEGRHDVVHLPRMAGGAFLDQLHPGHRPPYAPECGGMGRTAQHAPLLGPGLPPQIRTCCTLALSWEANMFLHLASDNHGWG